MFANHDLKDYRLVESLITIRRLFHIFNVVCKSIFPTVYSAAWTVKDWFAMIKMDMRCCCSNSLCDSLETRFLS